MREAGRRGDTNRKRGRGRERERERRGVGGGGVLIASKLKPVLTCGAPRRLLLPPRHVGFGGPAGEFFCGPGDPRWPGRSSEL